MTLGTLEQAGKLLRASLWAVLNTDFIERFNGTIREHPRERKQETDPRGDLNISLAMVATKSLLKGRKIGYTPIDGEGRNRQTGREGTGRKRKDKQHDRDQ